MYLDLWMQAMYHGNVYNVACQIFQRLCLIPPTRLKQTDNQFSSLNKCSNLSSPGMPTATSSPKDKPNKGKSTQKSKIKRPIRILSINFQSICNKNITTGHVLQNCSLPYCNSI